MITSAVNKHPTLCWTCGKACGRCSWSKNFTPVEGWKAIPTKIHQRTWEGKTYSTDSFDVYECPEYELMEELKSGKVEKRKKTWQRDIKEILYLRFVQCKTLEEVSEITGCSMHTIKRICKQYKECETL